MLFSLKLLSGPPSPFCPMRTTGLDDSLRILPSAGLPETHCKLRTLHGLPHWASSMVLGPKTLVLNYKVILPPRGRVAVSGDIFGYYI